ncbi:MAG: DUF2167 domain-containing protein [Saprospiraceae bacterium]|nr:DUF2167 domain-containing protein [Bacteroidia bacterium]NNE15784.1 DUF2167 domain-containing protein [Saprospiraceae bacterium]NNL92224.1 DUF2167 domain-containing protein [Saprospiraceae bacterium]
MKKQIIYFLIFIFGFTTFGFSSDTIQQEAELTEAQYLLLYQMFVDSFEQTLTYQHETVNLKGRIASIDVPDDFKYLNGADSEKILTDIWGNPPSTDGDQSLGMLIPINQTPFSDSTYAINITYSEEGYIKDEDAEDIDYDELLETMQDDTKEYNKFRVEQGYQPMHLIGWASPPFYDHVNKKLHWAKELKFGDMEVNTLNYNIRILGRKGFLQLNAIGEMSVLDDVKENIDHILTSVNFTKGYAYDDFNPDIDKVAAYGIGGLIAGKVLLKAGLFAKLGILLAKFWKVIAIAFIAIFAGAKMLFNKKEEFVNDISSDE